MEAYKIIYDNALVQKFAKIVLKPCTNQEVYFLSLSIRKKYLSKQERELYNLNRTEMYAKTIVHNSDDFFRKIKRFECNKDGFTTKNNQHMPEKALVCYANINPLNMVKAYIKFQSKVMNLISENLQEANQNYTLLNNLFLKEIQNSKGTKHWIDIDIDSEFSEKYVNQLTEIAKKFKIEYLVIKTKSGLHILFQKNKIILYKEEFKLYKEVEKINEMIKKTEKKGEAIFNKNNMVPVPGTYQGGFKVSIYDSFFLS